MNRFSRESISNIANKVVGPLLVLTGIGIAATAAIVGKPENM